MARSSAGAGGQSSARRGATRAGMGLGRGNGRFGRLIVGMRQELAPDALIARIAANQHGVITNGQLLRSGLTGSGISRRVAAGRLIRVHRGVYAVGHAALSQDGIWMAAVLACGKGAVLSHRSAGALWRMIASPPRPIDVSVPGRTGRRRRPGIRIHRPSVLLPSEMHAPTFDLGHEARTHARGPSTCRLARRFAAALREAEYLRLPVGDQFGPDGTHTKLEARFLALCRRHRLPRPEANVPIGPYKVDFLWREQRLVVEVDGWDSHRSRSAFETDRARDAKLKTWGYEVVRFTWRQLTDDPKGVAITVRALLAGRRRDT
jgi:very-short-patch-repair endonuclease